ncbi:GntR family transcriptional regulator [Sulfitobacter porphyrae]|uniref:GntR family transcriptional regulator n=1 Tax=Sulfitobacter porphyrae TaxID=1246864 RepID=A0ABW2B7D8_9RHOB|nr:transcriptional regulator [Sulfitobacter porphyrae]
MNSENHAPDDVGQITASNGIKRISASQQIHDALRNRIVSLDLAPGQYLSRSAVSDTYKVSLTPVREAMQRLEEEGLLLIYPQSKTEVSRIDVAHAQETQFLRLSLELEVVRRLALAADIAAVDALQNIIARQDLELANGDIDRFRVLDQDFHRHMCHLVGVDALWSLITARSGHIDRLRNLNLPDPGKSNSIMDCHRRIVSTIKSGQVSAAQEVVREHLSGTLSSVDDIRRRHPEYF